MRKTIWFVGLALAGGALLALPGCFYDYMDDCNFNIGLKCYWDNQGGGGGGTGGSPPGCVPSDTNKDIDLNCGAFVSPTGQDINGDGTRDNPYLTIGYAAKQKPRVYVCANAAKPFDEAVAPTADVVIYGGLDCANDWVYDPTKKSVWTAPADSVPLTVTGSVHVEVYDFAITSRDAATAGGSSVAVLAAGDKAELTLERCQLVAGAGKDGEAGTTPDMIGPNGEGKSGDKGGDGKGGDMNSMPLCMDTSYAGGAGGQNTCGLEMADVSGGLGGGGTNAAKGANGIDGNPMEGTNGKGGVWDDANGVCNPGSEGANGNAGKPGAGATGVGTLTAAGYSGVPGEDGKEIGKHGQGGGGGGGAKKCAIGTNAGPGGGGGGAGGCGGLPGTGGKAAGASIGIAAVGAKAVTLITTTITAGQGGNGGNGANGQPGGFGGLSGAPGGGGACQGGPGGGGGHGSSGGGGLGGHSLAIAFTGTVPVQTDVGLSAGQAGTGGLGGDNDTTVNGADGQPCKILNFDKGKCE